jgi:hypothetical protein
MLTQKEGRQVMIRELSLRVKTPSRAHKGNITFDSQYPHVEIQGRCVWGRGRCYATDMVLVVTNAR